MVYFFYTVLIGEAYCTSCYVCSDESCLDPYEGLEDHVLDCEYFEMNGTTAFPRDDGFGSKSKVKQTLTYITVSVGMRIS